MTWGQALVDLIDHEAIMPRLKFILGEGFRLDHYYAIYMEQDGTASRLHGANTLMIRPNITTIVKGACTMA